LSPIFGGLDCPERADGEVEDRGDKGKGASDGYAYQAEGKQDEPDKWIEDERSQRKGPAEEGEEAKEEEVEHRIVLSLQITLVGVEKFR
jgi:hypothetical protein